jgi:hypothetical protein
MRLSISLLLATPLLAAAVAVIAVADHRHVREEVDRAYPAARACAFKNLRCDETMPGDIHSGWEKREYTYDAVEGLLALAFVFSAVRLVRLMLRR